MKSAGRPDDILAVPREFVLVQIGATLAGFVGHQDSGAVLPERAVRDGDPSLRGVNGDLIVVEGAALDVEAVDARDERALLVARESAVLHRRIGFGSHTHTDDRIVLEVALVRPAASIAEEPRVVADELDVADPGVVVTADADLG